MYAELHKYMIRLVTHINIIKFAFVVNTNETKQSRACLTWWATWLS
jgi:hypothetical protein